MTFELAPFARPADYGEGIVPLADVKAHLAIDEGETELDDLVGLFRDAAVDMVERYCEVRLAECLGLEWQAEALPEKVRLGVGPVSEIVSIEYLDRDNAPQAGDVNTLRIARAMRGEIVPLAGENWPSNIEAGITITFNAGFSNETRPPALVQAVKLFTAHLFANREAVITGTISGEIPLGFKALCAPYAPVVV